eukprot:8742083-Ditylum_brightwellii.AAC.1
MGAISLFPRFPLGKLKGNAATAHAGKNLLEKAVKVSKGTVKKTLTTITDTSDERGIIDRVALEQGNARHKGGYIGNQPNPPKDPSALGFDT